MFTLRRVTVPVLPSDAADLTILHLSDLHPHAEPDAEDRLAPGARRPRASTSSSTRATTWRTSMCSRTFCTRSSRSSRSRRSSWARTTTSRPTSRTLRAISCLTPARRVLACRASLTSRSASSRAPCPGRRVDLDNRRARTTIGGLDVALAGLDDPHIDRDKMPAPDQTAAGADLRLGVVHAAVRPGRRRCAAARRRGAHHRGAHARRAALPTGLRCARDEPRPRPRARPRLHGWPGARPDEFGGHDPRGCTSPAGSARPRTRRCDSHAARPRRSSTLTAR